MDNLKLESMEVMVEATQWVVTYTRHKTQKRKVYHDGILVVKCCNSGQKKVLLYDDCGNLLENRFLRGDEKIECGETFEFDSVLVDIGDAMKKETHFLDITNQEKHMKIAGKGILPKRANNYRAFVKVSEEKSVQKTGLESMQRETNVRNSNTKEWSIVYTKQKNQKAKKYHDGILQLVIHGLQQKQVVLLSEDGKILQKKYLSHCEDVETNNTLEFEEYLVEVGEPKVCQTESSCRRSLSGYRSILEKRSSVQEQQSTYRAYHAIDAERPFSNDGSSQVAGTMEINAFNQNIAGRGDVGLAHDKFMNANRVSVKEPLRNVNQILTVLKKPVIAKDEFLDVENIEPKLNKLPTSGEACLSNSLIATSKVATPSDTEFPSKDDASNGNGPLDLSRGNHVGKCLSGVTSFSLQFEAPEMLLSGDVNNAKDTVLVCKEGSSLKDTRSLSIRNTRSLGHSTRHFQAPKIEFNVNIQHLVFPENVLSQKFRQVFIPDEFSCYTSYRRIMTSAVYEEINLTLCDIANEFHKTKEQLSHLHKRRPLCKHGKGRMQIVKKDGPNKGRLFYGCPSQVESCLFAWADGGQAETANFEAFDDWSNDEMEHAFSCFNIGFYTQCEIFTRNNGNFFSKKKKRDEFDCGDEIVGLGKASTYLKLGSSRNDKGCKHSKGDLWIISSNSNLNKNKRDDFVAFVVSDYHGPSSNGILEVKFLGGKPHNMPVPFKNAYALHGPCIQCELAMLNILRDLQPHNVPLLPFILQAPKIQAENSPSIVVEELADDFVMKYKLNEDQVKVLHFVAKWFTDSSSLNSRLLSPKPEICLVHGTFGSGKSYILAVITIFLTTVLKRQEENTPRILISAATNVAIDRVLMALLELGFSDFIRVGSIKKIARNILPYSVYAASDEDSVEGTIVKEIQERLRESPVHERLEMEEELKSFMDGKMAKRREKLKDVQVVGVTCYSTTNPILKGNKFQICILDECSQIPEPLSLLPLSQFGCIKLIAVGDPAQLPPALLGGSDLVERKDPETTGDLRNQRKKGSVEQDENEKTKGSTSFHDLRRALFVRLIEMGHEPIMLRTQYRCHPRLIIVPNELFYGGRIVSGCREIDRPPLLSGLPPLLFLDTCTHGSEIKDSSKSYNNPYEAKIACQLISMMLEHGIPGCEIGVIVLYKSQAYLVQEVLFQGCSFRRLDKNAINSTKAFEGQRVKRSVSKNHVAENHEKQGSSVSEIQISTVDAFQGMEKNIIILSCCRTNGLGFLSSPNRLNVALTRARHHLIVIGKASNLRSSPYWEKLLSSSVSSSGSYISMPTSGSEFILSWRQKHILRKDPSNIGDISLLSFDEKQGDASDGPDACILNAQSNQYKEESNILPLDAVGSTRTSDAFQMTVLPEGAAADNDSSMSFDIKKKRMRIEKSESRLIGKESAYMAKGYGNDLEMTYTEGSQTAKFVDVNESWIEDTTDCTNMKQDVALSECEQENDMNKAKPTKDDGSFEPGEVSNLALDCHFTPLIDAPYPSESNKSMILLRSGSTSDSRIVYDETSNDTEPSELLLTSEGEPTNGSANLVLKSVTIDVSEDSKSVFNRPDEATNGFGSNDMDRDDFAPTFNLGF